VCEKEKKRDGRGRARKREGEESAPAPHPPTKTCPFNTRTFSPPSFHSRTFQRFAVKSNAMMQEMAKKSEFGI